METTTFKIKEYDTKEYDRAYVALATPFKEDTLELDENSYRDLVRSFTQDSLFSKANGAIIANAQASETYYLTQEERDLLTTIALKETNRKFPVFVGAYGESIFETIHASQHSRELGADGIFAFPPSGTSEVSTKIDTDWNPEIWTEHIRTIAQASGLPIVLHASATHTQKWGGGLSMETVKMLLENIPSIVGYKMIFGNEAAWYEMAQEIRSVKRHVAILETTHTEPYTFQSEILGISAGFVDGLVQGAFNFVKEPLCEFITSVNEGDLQKAERVWTKQVQPIYNVVYGLGGFSRSHIHYKIATWIRGFIPHPFMRPPMPLPRIEETRMIFKVMEKTGLSHISESKMESTMRKGNEIYRKYIEQEMKKRISR